MDVTFVHKENNVILNLYDFNNNCYSTFSLPDKFARVKREYQNCTTLSAWSSISSLGGIHSRWELGSKVQAFRAFNFSVVDVKFAHFSGEIEFRFEHPPAADYLLDTMFLLKILQTQASNDGCWFFNEKLSAYQERLHGFLNGARKLGMVRKFQIGNRSSWVTVKTEDFKSERPIYIQEPKAQILDHTQLVNNEPSRSTKDWAKLIKINKSKNKRNSILNYNYATKTFYFVNKSFGSKPKETQKPKGKPQKRKSTDTDGKNDNKKGRQD